MDKHRYSTLTDKQHERLVREIERLQTVDGDGIARSDARCIADMLRLMQTFGFVLPAERGAYLDYMQHCIDERKNKKEKATV